MQWYLIIVYCTVVPMHTLLAVLQSRDETWVVKGMALEFRV